MYIIQKPRAPKIKTVLVVERLRSGQLLQLHGLSPTRLQSVGIPRQEYWSGGPFPSPGIFLTQGSNPQLLHWQADSSPLSHLGRSPKSELWLSKWTHSFWHFWHIRRTNQTKRHSMTKTQEHVPTNILCDDWSWNGASKWNYVKSMIAIPNNSWFWESTK